MTNEVTTNPPTHALLSNSVYDKLKYVVTIVLPALALFYLNLAPIWGLPKAEAVATTIGAVNVFLGVVMRLSTKSYNNSPVQYDGELTIQQHPEDPESSMLRLTKIEPTSLDPNTAKKELLFKVVNPSS
jgi:hypothetical protein